MNWPAGEVLMPVRASFIWTLRQSLIIHLTGPFGRYAEDVGVPMTHTSVLALVCAASVCSVAKVSGSNA